MNSIKISDHDFYYYDSTDPVISYLKNGQLFGSNNYMILNAFMDKANDGWIVDCGSHIGTFGFLPALENQNILMIDGAVKNVECLEKTFHNMSNVKVEQCILLDKQAKCNFSSDYGPFGSASLSDNGDQLSNTLDNILKKHKIDKIKGIKIDIEGNEYEAIHGAIETINKFLPPILLEINGYCLLKHEKTPQTLLKLMEDLGYLCFLPHQYGLIPFFSDRKFPFCVEDLICIHKNNIHKYIGLYGIANKLSDEKINEILDNNKNTSNEECKEYFNAIV
jgi:FkbM family methyltransferase